MLKGNFKTHINKKERKLNIQIKTLNFFQNGMLKPFRRQTENIYYHVKYICPLTQKFHFWQSTHRN